MLIHIPKDIPQHAVPAYLVKTYGISEHDAKIIAEVALEVANGPDQY